MEVADAPSPVRPPLRLAVAQVTSGPDPEANLSLVAQWSGRAAAQAASVVVFPEATMAWFERDPREVAEASDGPWATRIAELAATLGLTIVVGGFTRGPHDQDRIRNTLLVTDGSRTLSYDKIHVFDAFGQYESRSVVPGDAWVTCDIGGVPTGLAICYDIRFPELVKCLAHDGAELILVAASWAPGPQKVEMWRHLVIARALDSTCFVVGCGQADPAASGLTTRAGAATGVGHSLVVDPLGQVLAAAGAGPELLVVDLDPGVVSAARAQLPVLQHSRLRSGWPERD